MMLLGLVVHSAITYGVYEDLDVWALRDSMTHLSNDFIVSFIHAFRMPIFFLVAGFFGSMLFYERKPVEMIKNRISRIIIPFIVFMILLWPTIVFAFGYSMLVFSGVTNPLEETICLFSGIDMLIPRLTFHLWFLYYLGLITFVSVSLALLVRKTPIISRYTSKVFNWILERSFLRIIIFASITSVVYIIMGTWSVFTSTSFVPDFNTFFYYFMFYIIGWVLYKSQHLLDSFMKYDFLFTLLAIILFSVYFFMNDSFDYLTHIILKSMTVWLFVFGITGLFVRYTSYHSPIMRYLSDSSYWVYLVHLSFTAIIPCFISGWSIPATLKFLFVLLTTSFLCFVSYHYLVRGTFIGKFLNGRKYSIKFSEIRKK